MGWHIDAAQGKRRFRKAMGTVGGAIKKLDGSIKSYSAKAPERRAATIKRLQDEVKIAKLRKQKARLNAPPKTSKKSYDPFAGF